MTASLGKAIVELSANTTQFQRDMGRAAAVADRRMREIERSAKKVDRAIATLSRGVAGLAGILSGGAIIRGLDQISAQAQNLAQISANLDFPVERLQAFFLAADRAAVSQQQLTTAFQRMQRRVSQAADGTGEAADALKELGLNARDLERLNIVEQFDAINDRVSKLAAPDRTRLLQKIFDSEGVRAIQDTARELETVDKRFDDIILTDEQIKNLNTLRTLFDDIAASAKGAVTQSAAFFGGLLANLKRAREEVDLTGRSFALRRQGIDPRNQLNRGPPRRGGPRRQPFTIRLTEPAGVQESVGSGAAQSRNIAFQDFQGRPRPAAYQGALFNREYADLIQQEELAAKQRNKQLEENERRTRQAQEAARDLGLTFTTAFEDAVLEGRKLGEVLKALVKDIARVFIRRGFTEPIVGAASNYATSLFNPQPTGSRQYGGGISAGRAYMVGEDGPELAVFGASGSVIPNNQLGGMTVNITAVDAADVYTVLSRDPRRFGSMVRQSFGRRGQRVNAG